MSLHEVSDGLLETHVTWQDVESEMQKALGTTAKFGENKKATNISDMKGFMSRIALIDPDWVNHDNQTSNVPERFIVKMSSQLALVKISEMLGIDLDKMMKLGNLTREAHNREVESYKFLTKLNNPKIPFTKAYALRCFDEENQLKGFIISEFVPNAVHLGMHQDISSQDLEIVVKALGTLSAYGEKSSEEELEFVGKSDMIEIIMREMFDEEQLKNVIDKLRSAFPEEYQEKYAKYEEIITQVYSNPEIVKKYTTISEYLGAKNVICHCDPWSSNFLFNQEGDRVVLKAIIDWQSTSKCNPALDICRNLVACMSAEERAVKKDYFLKLYYNAMLEELGENAVAPYTLQQLHDSYHLHIPYVSLLVLPGIIPFLENAAVSEEEKPKVRKQALAKMAGLLEEILESHEHNMKKFPDFFIV